MITKAILIEVPDNMDARPVALLVQVASQYKSSVHVISGDKKVNAKSIMGMMTLGITSGETVTVEVDGSDEEEAIENIEKYLSDKE